MRICFIDDSVGLTGSGLYLYFIANNLLKNGEEVCYLHLAETEHIKQLKKFPNFSSYLIIEKNSSKFMMINKLSTVDSIKKQLESIIKIKSVDIIHFNESFNPYLKKLKKFMQKNNIKAVTTAHGCVNYEAKTIITNPSVNFTEKFKHIIYYPSLIFWEIYNLPYTPHYLSVTLGIKTNLIRLGKKYWHEDYTEKITHIPNGVNIERFKTRTPDPATLLKFKPTQNEIIILFTGGLVIRKLPTVLIKAFAILHQEFPLVRLVFAGGGRIANICKELVDNLNISEFVSFLGYVEYDEIPKILSIADLFVLPSIYETPGISILEAMSMKVPVIASNYPDIPELITNNETGILFENNKNASQNLYEAMKLLLTNKEICHQICNKAEKYVKENHDLNLISKKVYDYYKEILR